VRKLDDVPKVHQVEQARPLERVDTVRIQAKFYATLSGKRERIKARRHLAGFDSLSPPQNSLGCCGPEFCG
jgi:hypothetical protein